MVVKKHTREGVFKGMVRASLTAHQTCILVEEQAETASQIERRSVLARDFLFT